MSESQVETSPTKPKIFFGKTFSIASDTGLYPSLAALKIEGNIFYQIIYHDYDGIGSIFIDNYGKIVEIGHNLYSFESQGSLNFEYKKEEKEPPVQEKKEKNPVKSITELDEEDEEDIEEDEQEKWYDIYKEADVAEISELTDKIGEKMRSFLSDVSKIELKPKEKEEKKLRNYVYYKMINRDEEQWLLTSSPLNEAIILRSKF
jgi:hypothetical protein